MDALKAKTKCFRFLGQEQFAALTAREKLAYLAAAITELQRRPGPTPHQSEKHQSQNSLG